MRKLLPDLGDWPRTVREQLQKRHDLREDRTPWLQLDDAHQESHPQAHIKKLISIEVKQGAIDID